MYDMTNMIRTRIQHETFWFVMGQVGSISESSQSIVSAGKHRRVKNYDNSFKRVKILCKLCFLNIANNV